MRRLILIVLSAVSALYAGAQRYDYDDIYFNPKTDLVVNEETADEMAEADEVTATPSASVAVAPEEGGGVSVSVLSSEPFEYSRRIQKFHTEQDTSGISPYIADTNYVNIFMLGDGSYRLNVDGDQVDIASYDGYDYGYWGYPYDPYWSYYDSWLWYRPWYSGYWGFRWGYDPYWGFNWGWGYYPGWYYDPFYWGWGHHHHYWHHHHHHWDYGHHHHYADRWRYDGSENQRRRINAGNRMLGGGSGGAA